MAFDPNQPFEKVEKEQTSEGFDPNQPFETIQKDSKPGFFEEGGTLKSAISGVAQGITFGFSDEIAAGLRTGFGQFDDYDEALAEQRARHTKSKEESPAAFTTGEVAGSLAAPVPGLGLAKAATTAGKIGTGVATGIIKGAAVGAAEGAGRTENSLLSEEGLLDVAKGAGLGGALGGIIPAVGAGISKAKSGIVSTVDKAKSTLPSPTSIRSGIIQKTAGQRKAEILDPRLAEASDEAVKVGEKHGVFAANKKSKLIPNVQKKINEIGKEIGDEAEKFSPKIKPKTAKIEESLLSKVASDESDGLLDVTASKRMQKIIKTEMFKLNSLIKTKKNPLVGIRTLKKNLAKRLNSKDYTGEGPKSGTAKDAVKRVHNELVSLERSLAPTQKYKTLLDDFGALKELEGNLAQTIAKKGTEGVSQGAIAFDLFLGNPIFTGLKLARGVLDNPTGRLMISNILEGNSKSKAKALSWLASKTKKSPKLIKAAIEDLKRDPNYVAAGLSQID